MMQTLLAAGAAFLVSALLCFGLSRYRGRAALLDQPNERSLHAQATPRTGGLGILMSLALALGLSGLGAAVPGAAWVALGFLIVALVSFADDIWHLPPGLRILAHLLAAGLLVFAAGYAPVLHLLPGINLTQPAWLLQGFALIAAVWFINLYNFMDGMDGFAGGMAVIGFGTLALLGWWAHAPIYGAGALCVALAAAGFLPSNFPPARLFMGDVGSGSLGFLVALFLLWAERAGLFPLWLGGLVFSPFIVDATWTVLRRSAQGKRPWQAHREHFYQRVVQAGWSHKRTALWGYSLMLKCSLLALVCFWFTDPRAQGIVLGLAAAVYLALIVGIRALERARS